MSMARIIVHEEQGPIEDEEEGKTYIYRDGERTEINTLNSIVVS